ncbi:hypothetical protein FQN60_004712 [Etheostoma spectabile]|uniref:Uncharacterized protein n=1 Tax=Etheostoma spectabile TaxID=54343 RepID=A0A5J5DKY4_9PERO|nr:hypothetical protein FQN60_004712 [Etheostoma spectabile]
MSNLPMSVKPCCWFSITDVSSSSSSSPQSAILAGGMHCSRNRSSSSSSMSMFSGGQRSSPLSTSLKSVGSTTMEGRRSLAWSWSRQFKVVSGPRTTSTGSGKIWREMGKKCHTERRVVAFTAMLNVTVSAPYHS